MYTIYTCKRRLWKVNSAWSSAIPQGSDHGDGYYDNSSNDNNNNNNNNKAIMNRNTSVL
uniref:Uncharacterized protein n=1 Tax=Anguilla anguilla TaxID=7936 RepID=A0A0E9WHI5_ANGAN